MNVNHLHLKNTHEDEVWIQSGNKFSRINAFNGYTTGTLIANALLRAGIRCIPCHVLPKEETNA